MKERHGIAIFLIISIFSMGLLSTYAWLTWSSPKNTKLHAKVGEFLEVIFNTGNAINETELAPILDPDVNGEITEFYVVNNSKSMFYTVFKINITELPDELKTDSFSYKILSSSNNKPFTEIATGSFKDMVIGDNVLYSNIPTDAGITYYKFIIYLDGYKETPVTAMNKSFSGILNVELTTDAPISEYVMALSNEVVGWEAGDSGIFKTEQGDYRYVGANVDNYVSFNNDLYRIIGVFDEKSHGQEGQMLTKLIAANPLTANSWGVYNSSTDMATYAGHSNDWTGNTTGVKANANVLLNEFFYTKSWNNTIYGNCGDWTYIIDDNKTKDCTDIVGYGIDSSLQEYISNADWYLYGYPGNTYSKEAFYYCERQNINNDPNCLVGGTSESPHSEYESAKIGLMYVSDYLYASTAYKSNDEEIDSNQIKYGNKNWLFKGFEWTITPSGGKQKAFFVSNIGKVSETNDASINVVPNGLFLRPTFYLKSDVYVNGGDGTFEKPYIIVLK